MANCHICERLAICPWASPQEIICSSFKRKPTTHYDEIHAMSAEELAQWIASRKETCPPIKGYKCSIMTCGECWLDYLKQEVEA